MTLAFLTVSQDHTHEQQMNQVLACGRFDCRSLHSHFSIVSTQLSMLITCSLNERDLPAYLNFRMLYEVLFEVVLAFGMVILSTDRMRGELERKNQLLAQAAHEQSLAARLDGLTGLHNRRAFEELIVDSYFSSHRFGSIAVIDVNNLKPLNDQYGHAAGDVALRLLARALQFHFRTSDPMFRIGGDEFAVVMLGCSQADLSMRMA